MNIKIISASVRTGRNSHRVALYFQNYINNHKLGEASILDLAAYNFPLFEERLQYQTDPSREVLDYAAQVTGADGIILVTPEYNGGYPASLKNAIDLLYKEWKRKPIAMVTISDGPFAGTQVMTSLLFSLWKIGAWVVPAMYAVPKVAEAYQPDGTATDPIATDKRAGRFLDELLWCMRAKKKMEG